MKTLKRNHCSHHKQLGPTHFLMDVLMHNMKVGGQTGLKGENLAGSLKRVMCERYHVGWYAFKI